MNTAKPFRLLRVFAGMAMALVFALAIPAQAQTARQFELSERVGEELSTKFQPLVEAKNWEAAIKLIANMANAAAPNSYDQAYLNDVLARLYLQEGKYDKAIPPYEIALRLGDTYGYFDAKAIGVILDYLAKMYYQEGTASKSPAQQQQYLAKATVYLKRIIDATPTPSVETASFYTTLLYNRAILNPENPDKELLNQAKAEAQKALLLATRPKENFYVILLSTLQQLGDYKQSADYLELLVKQYPSNKVYWQQLMAVYASLAQEERDEVKAKEYSLRAILTIERAQALGFQNTPKDHYNLVVMYFNLGQFDKATELLYSGLKKGVIDSTLQNWALLASSYQQVNKESQAIEALSEATKQFPQSGQLEFQIGQIYYSMDRINDAYRHFQLAVAKGNLDKPAAVYSFLAYICYELNKYEEALSVIGTAEELSGPQGPDAQLTRLRQAVEDSIRDRDSAKAAKEARLEAKAGT